MSTTTKTIIVKRAYTKAELNAQKRRLSAPRKERTKGGLGLTLAQTEKALKALSAGKSGPFESFVNHNGKRVRLYAVPTKADKRAVEG